jgi:hypothetical protein
MLTPDQIAAYATALVAVIGAITTLIVTLRSLMVELKKNTAATVQAAEIGQDTHDALQAAGIPVPPPANPEGTKNGTV